MIRTFIDAGVLIYAARSQGDLAERAFQILEDENREFASSINIEFIGLVRYETLLLSGTGNRE